MASITFTGDIAFSKYFKEHWNKDFLDEKIKYFLRNADHVVANVESPLTEAGISSKMEISHLTNPNAFEWFKSISADIWTISNNHILDCGESGMLDTINAAQKSGARTVGAGRNIDEASEYITLDCEGGIGIFAVTYKRAEFIRATENSPGCVLFDETERIKKAIKEIKEKNKWCIIIAHGGDEFSNLPMPYMKKLYRKFLKFGADVVVGHHPHVVQDYEKVGNKMIFYSLGNFVFDTDYQRKQKYSEYGVLLNLSFNKDGFSWDYLATKVNRESQTVETTTPPMIFREISKKDYTLLWPLGATKFLSNFVVAKTFVIPKTRNYKWYNWFNLHREKIGLKNALCLYWGKFISIFSLWRFADKDLCGYIEQNQ